MPSNYVSVVISLHVLYFREICLFTIYTQIVAVRVSLGGSDYEEREIKEALMFVMSQRSKKSFYLDPPPPDTNVSAVNRWLIESAAKVLKLRHLYGIAFDLNLEECYDNLKSRNWNVGEALPDFEFA